MSTLFLAWRNVLRNRRRSAITLATIAVAAMAVVMLGGYVAATIKGLETLTVRQVGHLQVMSRGYLEFGRANPARHALRDYAPLAGRLRADPQLAPLLHVVTPTLQVQGVAGHFASASSSTFSAAGWVADDRARMLAWDGLRLGTPPLPTALRADRPDDGVIGVGLAQLLDLCDALAIADCVRAPAAVPAAAAAIDADLAALSRQAREAGPAAPAAGAVVVDLLAAGASGAPNIVRMTATRAERQGVRELDMVHVGLPLALAQRLVFGTGAAGASALVLQLEDSARLDEARARVAAVVHDYAGDTLEVRTFAEVSPSYNQVVRMFRTLFGFVSLLMAVVTLFAVANTVNMAVSERTGEIGSLRAIGLPRARIRRMFVLEGGLVGAFGAVLGVALAVVLAGGLINHAGFSWTPPGNITPVPITIDVQGSARLCLGTVLAMTLIACISSWWPARRAARLEIVEALRHA
ncbi:FtsX-like permease family protein [Azoarcus olearius]|uniref:Conserved hypothetical membrane protein n=1 Tax=Azoarcus sp. (strain BH72) TaxID=418699 RepID=A1K1G9_AZOSB|nr:FtsX-like permease family protein [Azoarcus olearius]CAL92674.1 conserved hypothetical membrane protein [Azoarcus olearius]